MAGKLPSIHEPKCRNRYIRGLHERMRVNEQFAALVALMRKAEQSTHVPTPWLMDAANLLNTEAAWARYRQIQSMSDSDVSENGDISE